ncbi:MAG TPA: hypothetical protein VFV38_24320 [Ktedonobacteraceae bacterium]|nr:hypothetical protein [Ktedonobacteraceae bacterium]
MLKLQVEDCIIEWASEAFYDERNDIAPEIEVLSLQYDREEDLWEAELYVSACPNDVCVTFWLTHHHFLRDNDVHIETVEYLR